MSYNPHNQYRCTIIRGKAKNELDDLLPAYAAIIDEITPLSVEKLSVEFNSRLQVFLPNAGQKTLDNHRTEIVEKLFGMIFVDEEGTVFSSERTQKFLKDGDQPSFFKDFCFKFQFPNAADSLPKMTKNIEHRISVRPYCLVVSILRDVLQMKTNLTKNEIAYFILNNLDALQGKSSNKEIIDSIFDARRDKKLYRVEKLGKESSYTTQHITEQLNHLKLANLIREIDGVVYLNKAEDSTISAFSKDPYKLLFDIYSYSLETAEFRKQLREDWQRFYSQLSEEAKNGKFETTIKALETPVTGDKEEAPQPLSQLVDTMQIGDDGERLVFKYEVKRIGKYNKRLVNKVLLLGKIKGLGYDIQSIFGSERREGEFVKYIEVKTTKRATLPKIENKGWLDTFNITRNEWIAASQHKDSFEIYRVYLTGEGPLVVIIKNPYVKNKDSKVEVLPTNYRLDFNGQSVDSTITEKMLV